MSYTRPVGWHLETLDLMQSVVNLQVYKQEARDNKHVLLEHGILKVFSFYTLTCVVLGFVSFI